MGRREKVSVSLSGLFSNLGTGDNKPIRPEQYQGRPVLLCEYAFAMENSLGNFQEYMDVFEKYQNLAGGFLWNWADMSIRRVSPDGGERWLYGGDFGEVVTDHTFCLVGIVAADRIPHPSYYEVKKVYQRIHVEPVDLKKGVFRIENRFSFLDLSGFTMMWQLSEDGKILEQHEEKTPVLAPGESAEVTLHFRAHHFRPKSEYQLTVFFLTKKDTAWCRTGFPAAFEQFELAEPEFQAQIHGRKPVKLVETEEKFEVRSGNFRISVSRKTGDIVSLNYGFGELISAPLHPNYWRAFTDNDLCYANYQQRFADLLSHSVQKWRTATEKRRTLSVAAATDDKTVTVTVEQRVRHCMGKTVTVYKIDGDGNVLIRHRVRPACDMLRIGFTLGVSEKYQDISWFGRGPHENYADRKTGAPVGLYSFPAEQMPHDYVRPQENGTRSDVRWMSMRNNSKNGLRFTGSRFGFSVWPYTQEDLQNAGHRHELRKRDFLTVNVDSVQCGVGGDVPGIAGIHDEYRIRKGQTFELQIMISGICETFRNNNR